MHYTQVLLSTYYLVLQCTQPFYLQSSPLLLMKILIDTQRDSKEDLKHVIVLLERMIGAQTSNAPVTDSPILGDFFNTFEQTPTKESNPTLSVEEEQPKIDFF